ncbi:LacI family transcriptional regulator [Clostridium polyendosporum]|uniref:LacI family transcriptional regulator n=1 Tax=Clostridium polyendosporum TaxID=69208 RepID=A0A919VEJ9_9CLOT|nr:LacI family DNA-binding transcriptional regulator [Clostridium polyendosporum]GIM29234.1 LacI family transcriptional regulator [Clostridium polyendosporum]
MNTTIKDVAREANVSPSTVSRVLAGSPRISNETKERVLEIVKRLNYHPNAIARSLANNVTKTLGLVLPSGEEDLFKNPFFIQAMTGISIYAQNMGYSIMYTFGKSEDEELAFISNYINSKNVDGIILLTSKSKDKRIQYLNEKGFPFVVIGRPEAQENVLWVDNDNYKAMFEAVNYLINKGHRDIGFIGGSEERNMSKDRLRGYRDALYKSSIEVDSNLIYEMNDFNEECGYEASVRILQYKKVTAIVTTDDLLAFGANKRMKEVNVNKDISIIGFNNIPLAQYQDPPLSTVDINAKQLGYYATKILIDSLESKEDSLNYHIVETKFIERESTRVSHK